MKVIKLSRTLDKTPTYFRNFILSNHLWPFMITNVNAPREPKLDGFSIASIQDDIRGNTVRAWQNVVNTYLKSHGGELTYNRATSKQHLTFENDGDCTMFIMVWA